MRSDEKPRSPLSADAITVALGNWAAGQGPVYRQLADAIRNAVTAGDLLPESRLPAERVLARQLAVSRTTVLAAFDELKTTGWLRSRQGSGTWLTQPDPRGAAPPDADSARSLRANAFLRPGLDAPIDLATAALPATPIVTEIATRLDPATVTELTSGHGYMPTGLELLHERVAERFAADGVPTDPAELLITTGTQQALALIAALAVPSGGTALVETPTSPGILDALRSVGADIRAVPVDNHGIRLDLLEELMTRLSPRAVFVIPTFQTPTGAVMPTGQRRRLSALAERLQILVVEDLSHAPLELADSPPPPLCRFGVEHIVSVGSMSKLFWSGLRVGWIRASRPLIARLTRLKATADLGSPLLSQLVAAQLLTRFDEVRLQRRTALITRLDNLDALLAQHLPAWRWERPPGGLSAWIELPHGDSSAFVQLAQRHGVVVVPGPLLSADEGHHRHLRLSFAAGLGMLEEGIERLARAWDAYVPSADRPLMVGAPAALG